VFKFCEICLTGNRWNRALFTGLLSLLLESRPKSATTSPRQCTQVSECSRFHPNRFIFGGVTAERVNTAKSPCEVNLIFGRSLASSRITSCITGFTMWQIEGNQNRAGWRRVVYGLCSTRSKQQGISQIIIFLSVIYLWGVNVLAARTYVSIAQA